MVHKQAHRTVTGEDRATFTTMDFKEAQRIQSVSQKVFVSAKVINSEKDFFNHGHKGLYKSLWQKANELHKYSLIGI